MKGCPGYKEYLYLDVIDELPPERREEWEAHLSTCASCRLERARMTGLLEKLGQEARPPSLSSFEARVLRQRIFSGTGACRRTNRLSGLLSGRLKLVISLATAACLVVVSWIGLRTWRPSRSHQTSQRSVAQVEQKGDVIEKEIIENLDLLEQMETLRALVRVVDDREIM